MVFKGFVSCRIRPTMVGYILEWIRRGRMGQVMRAVDTEDQASVERSGLTGGPPTHRHAESNFIVSGRLCLVFLD